MAFAQLTFRESLRDIETCLRASGTKLYNLGFRSRVSRSTLAEANDNRDWRVYADYALVLINKARIAYQDEDFGLELEQSVYALDSTVIDLCLSLCPWAQYSKQSAGVRLNAVLDLRGNIPCFVDISRQKVSELAALDSLVLEPGGIYIMDRGYFDWERLHRFTQVGASFITRGKKTLKFRRIYSRPVDKAAGIFADQVIAPSVPTSLERYPDQLRRIKYRDSVSGKTLTFLTNNFALPALTIAELYRMRWQIEIFFKWIKQHLRIKAFFGISENAVKTQLWIAISVYVLVALVKKRLGVRQSLYTILQFLSVSPFQKTPILQAFRNLDYENLPTINHNQLNLFAIPTGQ